MTLQEAVSGLKEISEMSQVLGNEHNIRVFGERLVEFILEFGERTSKFNMDIAQEWSDTLDKLWSNCSQHSRDLMIGRS